MVHLECMYYPSFLSSFCHLFSYLLLCLVIYKGPDIAFLKTARSLDAVISCQRILNFLVGSRINLFI